MHLKKKTNMTDLYVLCVAVITYNSEQGENRNAVKTCTYVGGTGWVFSIE